MKITNPEMKKIIGDIISFTDNIDEKTGNRERRTSINKKHYHGFQELKEKILVNSIEVAVREKEKIEDKEVEKVVWYPLREYREHHSKNPAFLERVTNCEIDLSEKALKAFKYYANERDEYPEVSPKTFEEFEKMIEDVPLIHSVNS